MPTYRLTLEYEGTRYRGWQEQKNARTVAGEVRIALEKVAGRVSDLAGSGRTDAGVHAVAQTAHARVLRPMDPERMRVAINDILPADIHVLSLAPAPERFHARHSAVSRSYLYQISLRRTAFAKRFVWWVKSPLDLATIREAARLIPGRHDFALFCERPADQTSTIVVVESASVVTVGPLLLLRFVASHFLWRMVRRLVGVLVEIGRGRLKVADFAGLIEGTGFFAEGEGPAKWTAPPSGLFLERVLYPGDPPLPALAPAVPVVGGEGQVIAPPARSSPQLEPPPVQRPRELAGRPPIPRGDRAGRRSGSS